MWIRLLAASTLLLAVAGCGETTEPVAGSDDPGGDGTTTAAETLPLDRPWLVRMEIGGSEIPDGVAYVRFVPGTGETVTTSINFPPQDVEPNPFLLVDAGREYAVRSNAASIREEKTARVKVFSLDGDRNLRLDLRKITGHAELKPLGWAFDPDAPALLRVLDRTGRLFEVDVPSRTSTEIDPVEPRKGYALAPVFDSADGMPLLRNRATWEYEPGGDYTAGGVHVVPNTKNACTPPKALSSAIADAAGTTWTACLSGRRVKLVRLVEGEDAWRQAGASDREVPKGTMSMSWVLPPIA